MTLRLVNKDQKYQDEEKFWRRGMLCCLAGILMSMTSGAVLTWLVGMIILSGR